MNTVTILTPSIIFGSTCHVAAATPRGGTVELQPIIDEVTDMAVKHSAIL